MIRKTRISFVVVTMTLLAAVIVFFVGMTIFINYQTSRNSTTYMLYKILFKPDEQNGTSSPADNENPNDRTCYALFDCFVTDDCVYVQDKSVTGNMFDDASDADAFVKQIIVDGVLKNSTKNEEGIYCGNVGTLYYAVKKTTNSGNIRIAVVDRALEEEMLRNTALTFATLSIAALLAIFVIVWVLSYRVVKPVSDAFDKQRRFISDASHELKTPVTIIRANAEALQSESDGSEWADNILSQTDRLTHLVEEMLTLARLEEKAVVKQHIDLSASVEAAALEFEPVAYEQNKKFVMNIDHDVTAYADVEDVRRVVSLLADNAVKYGESYIDIKFIRLAHGGKLIVENDGCQVPAEHKNKLFERFYREDSSRTRDTGGSGLGLATVKALCERNKWKVNVDCSLGGTMTVTVEMY